MVTTNLNLSMNNPEVVQIHAKQGDSGRIYKINLKDATEENGTLRILRPDGVEVTADAIKSAGGDAYKGDLVTFDALEEVPLTKAEVTLESSQDLHGQSNPYPAGGKGNLLPNNATDGTTTLNGITLKQENGVYSLSGTASDTTTFTISLATSVNLSPSTNKICFLNSGAYAQITVGFTRSGTRIHYWSISPSNRVVSGWTDTGNESIEGIHIQINSGVAISGTLTISPMLVKLTDTDPTSYAPYSNICPIEPSNGVNLVNIGGSVFDTQQNPTTALPLASYSLIKGFAYTGYVRPNNITSFSASGTTITLTTTSSDYGVGLIAEVEAGKTYTFSATHDGYVVFAYYDASGFFVSNENKGTQGSYSTTVPSGAKYLIALIRGATAGTSNISIDKPQLEQGTSASPYVPYQGINVYQSGEDTTDYTTYPLSLGRSVYGGKVDLVSGKLTVTHEIVDLGDLNWILGATDTTGVTRKQAIVNGIKRSEGNSKKGNIVCTCYPTETADGTYLKRLGIAVTSPASVSDYVFVYDPNYTGSNDIQAFTTSVTGQKLVYELATPIEYDLSPTQISTLLGQNNIWSSGEVEVAFEYDGLFAELPQQATEVVGRCLGDVNFTNVSTMPFTLNVIPNNQEETP